MILKRLMTGDGGFGPMICRKGGGGGGTSSSGISEEYRPHLTGALDKATSQLDQEFEGDRGAAVADQAKAREAIAASERVSQDALQGRGAFDNRAGVERQLQNLQGQSAYGNQGNLGSARAQRAQQAALADASLQFGQLDQQNQIAGAAGLGQAAQQGRALEQERLDAPHKSLDRYFGYLSGAPQTRTESRSGGK